MINVCVEGGECFFFFLFNVRGDTAPSHIINVTLMVQRRDSNGHIEQSMLNIEAPEGRKEDNKKKSSWV